MHRATPLNSSFRAFSAGGARSVVDKVDDEKLMQEMAGNFFANETRQAIEAAQNYGFTSVVFDAEKDAQGKILASAECFMSFIGGNRSFPAAGPMDDRRHRLFKLAKGDTAMFRGRGDKQQFHMTEDGGYWTAPQNKTVRMQLVPEDSESNASVQQGDGSMQQRGLEMQRQAGIMPHAGVEVMAGGAPDGGGGINERADGTGSGGQSQQQQQQKRGQEALYKKGQDSHRFIDATKDASRVSGDNVHLMLGDKKVYVHVADDKKVYLGGRKGEGTFARVMTESGPSANVYAKV
jgi:phage gp45-like